MNIDPNVVIAKLAARVSELEVEKAAMAAAIDQFLAHECLTVPEGTPEAV